jgi:hypothetical protein
MNPMKKVNKSMRRKREEMDIVKVKKGVNTKKK